VSAAAAAFPAVLAVINPPAFRYVRR